MKLKDSYILLIAMAIFLLMSIGSVCASEISADDTIGLADDGSDVVMDDKPIEPSNPTTPHKVDTMIVSSDTVSINEKEKIKSIDLTVNDTNKSKVIAGITVKNLTVKEGTKTIKFDYNNSKVIIKDALVLGKHDLLVSYLGNENYTNSSKNIVLTIFGNYTIQAPTSVDVNSTKIVEVPINVTNGIDPKELVKDDFNVTLTYKDGNITKAINITDFRIINNTIIFNYPLSRNITTSTITLVYTANETVKSKNVTINRIYNVKIEGINTKNQYKNGNFTFRLTDIDNATENLTGFKLNLLIGKNVINQITGTADKNGIVNFKTSKIFGYDFNNNTIVIKYLNVGNNTVELKSGDNVKLTTNKVNLTIEKAKINITIDKYNEQYGSNKNLTITVINADNGEPVPGIILHLNMPQTAGKNYYIQTDTNGIGIISVKGLIPGKYNLTVSNNDTVNIINNKASSKIIITPKPVTIKITSGLTINYNTGNTAAIKVTDKKGKGVSGAYVLVQLYTGSKSANYLFQTDKYGNIKFKAPLSVGKHKIVVSGAVGYSSSKVTKYIKVKKATAKISAPKVTAYYKQGKYFTIKLINTKKSNAPIYAAKVDIRVYISNYKYYKFNGKTGVDGKLKLSIDLKPKTYKVEVRGADSKNYAASKVVSKIVVVKAPTKLYPAKLTAKKGTNKYFKVTVKNTKTKKVIPGVKVKIKVYTGKKFKTYTVKTNSKGIAQFNVKSLSVGKHKAIVSSANKYCIAKSAKNYIKITK
ncbi:hypothetical protein SAMN05216439_0774 [Methanobrevibacter gottschalkii]|nr:hypothetical protein [Methanobrevibacter gottschalkii]MCQ2970157.1 hypothetical protein [archaeon]OEC93802.1 hypothetical protein A9505_01610 [Methanobrevibacter sp. A27]SEK30039.1 hypothetical protein SAMN05216439_0774 [Methanobrevibacter gottschalkii]